MSGKGESAQGAIFGKVKPAWRELIEAVKALMENDIL